MASRTSTFLRGSGALLSPRNGRGSGRLPSVKSNYSVRKSSRQGSGLLRTPRANDWKGGVTGKRGSRRKPCDFFLPDQLNALSSIPTSETSMEPDSGVQPYLPGVSHASLSVVPGSERAKKITATSGLKCSGSYRKQGPLGSLVRTLLESSTWNSNKCVLTWKMKAMKSDRLLFQLAPSTPRIVGIGSGYLLTTPQAVDASAGAVISKDDKFKILKSGRLRRMNRSGVDGSAGLSREIAMLPTPGTPRPHDNEETAGQYYQSQNQKDLTTILGTSSGPKLRLEPAFVEWMMGYPEGWTDLKHLGTPSSRKSHTKSSRKSVRLKA